MKKYVKTFSICLLTMGIALFALPALAGTIYWANWTEQHSGAPGSATGIMALPDGNVGVTYSGEVASWADHGDWNFPATYTQPGVVDNTPTPQYSSVTLNGNNTLINTISFSTSVLNPVMAIQSLGSSWNPAIYVFDSPFTILNYGAGHWGGGGVGSLYQSGNWLVGREGNGIIQFSGEYSSISWTVADGEYYHMFTVGAPEVPELSDSAAAVPEPSTLVLLGIGLAGFGLIRRRLRK